MSITQEKSPETATPSPSTTTLSADSPKKSLTKTKLGYATAEGAKTEEVVLNKDGTIDTMALSQSQMRFLAKYIKANGIVSYACKLAKISRDTYYRWLGENKTFEALIQRANEEPLDLVRLKLWEQIQKGNINAITLYLRAHDKAYSERVTHDGKITLSPSWYEDMKPKQIKAAKPIQVALDNKQLKQLDTAIAGENTKDANKILKEANDKETDSGSGQDLAGQSAPAQLGDQHLVVGTTEESPTESAAGVHPSSEG